METSQQEDLAAPDVPEEQFLVEESLVKISVVRIMCYYLFVVITGIF